MLILAKGLRQFICKWLKEGCPPEIIAFKAAEKNARWKTNYEIIYQWVYHERHGLILFLTRSHKKGEKEAQASGNDARKRQTVP
jgi:IS30 family transposase